MYSFQIDYTRLTSNRKSFPVNYTLILLTAKVFHLERFAMHGKIAEVSHAVSSGIAFHSAQCD